MHPNKNADMAKKQRGIGATAARLYTSKLDEIMKAIAKYQRAQFD